MFEISTYSSCVAGKPHNLMQGRNPLLPVISDDDINGVAESYIRQLLSVTSGETNHYANVYDIENAYQIFDLECGGISPERREFALRIARSYIQQQKDLYVGYQSNQKLDYSDQFGQYLDISINNVGDPFVEGTSMVNTKFMERAVLDYYARLWHACYPHNPKNPESYAMWNARDYLSGKRVQRSGSKHTYLQAQLLNDESPNTFTPMAFYSADTHYSIGKAMAMMCIRTFCEEGERKYPSECPLLDGQWPDAVPSLETGAIDIQALATLVEFFAARGYPIIVCFNYGTTFKGAYDDVETACKKLKPILQKYDLLERTLNFNTSDEFDFDTRTGSWFHVDGALGAAYMPFLEMAHKGGLIVDRVPLFDFRLPMVHSIAMSGHKWVGAPMPCGVYMSKMKYQMLPQDNVDYIAVPDTTFAGSHNGLTPMLMWDNIARHPVSNQIRKALKLLHLAQYTQRRLYQLQDDVIQKDIYVTRSPLSLTVLFKCPNMDLCKKYSLSSKNINGRSYAHIFCMENITTTFIDSLIHDLSQHDAFRNN